MNVTSNRDSAAFGRRASLAAQKHRTVSGAAAVAVAMLRARVGRKVHDVLATRGRHHLGLVRKDLPDHLGARVCATGRVGSRPDDAAVVCKRSLCVGGV